VWSKDGGTTWDGGGGLIPGSALTAYEVDPSMKPQTDQFATIAAGDPGKVDVSWLGTNEIEPTDPLGKFDPGGCAGSTAQVPVPPFYPPTCKWNLFTGQALDLGQPPDKVRFTISQATTKPMHLGDICNLGIFCTPGLSNRNLLDFNSEAVDPTTGCAHVAYSDDSNPNPKLQYLRAANQVSGPSIEGPRPCGATASHHGGHHQHHTHHQHHQHHQHTSHHKHHHHRRPSRRPRKHSRGFTG
jgi:hypothetical protein